MAQQWCIYFIKEESVLDILTDDNDENETVRCMSADISESSMW